MGRVHWGTYEAVAGLYETYDDVPEGTTYDELGFVPTATMEQD